MTNPPEDIISPDELSAAWGIRLGHALIDTITFKKTVQGLQSQIQSMTKNETRLTNHIGDLEEELKFLRSDNSELEGELLEIKTATRPSIISEKVAEIATQGDAIIKEKAAPD